MKYFSTSCPQCLRIVYLPTSTWIFESKNKIFTFLSSSTVALICSIIRSFSVKIRFELFSSLLRFYDQQNYHQTSEHEKKNERKSERRKKQMNKRTFTHNITNIIIKLFKHPSKKAKIPQKTRTFIFIMNFILFLP